jgi:hypothetical protein
MPARETPIAVAKEEVDVGSDRGALVHGRDGEQGPTPCDIRSKSPPREIDDSFILMTPPNDDWAMSRRRSDGRDN